MNWVDVLIQFEGIIGALGGVLLTFIATYFYNNVGKINVEVIDFNIYFYKQDNWGNTIETNQVSAENMTIEFSLNLYNSSINPKPMKNIEASLINQQGEIIDVIQLKDSSTKRISAGSVYYDEIYYINVLPKQVMKKDFQFGVSLKEKPELLEFASMKLLYENEKGKPFEIKIK